MFVVVYFWILQRRLWRGLWGRRVWSIAVVVGQGATGRLEFSQGYMRYSLL